MSINPYWNWYDYVTPVSPYKKKLHAIQYKPNNRAVSFHSPRCLMPRTIDSPDGLPCLLTHRQAMKILAVSVGFAYWLGRGFAFSLSMPDTPPPGEQKMYLFSSDVDDGTDEQPFLRANDGPLSTIDTSYIAERYLLHDSYNYCCYCCTTATYSSRPGSAFSETLSNGID